MLVATALTGQRDATACPTSDPAAPATATGPATATVMTSGSVRAEHQAALPPPAAAGLPPRVGEHQAAIPGRSRRMGELQAAGIVQAASPTARTVVTADSQVRRTWFYHAF